MFCISKANIEHIVKLKQYPSICKGVVGILNELHRENKNNKSEARMNQLVIYKRNEEKIKIMTKSLNVHFIFKSKNFFCLSLLLDNHFILNETKVYIF